VAFCLTEAWLRRRGAGWLGTAGAAVFASVAFGLFHYSHEEKYHALVFSLMPEMFLLIAFFVLTRNFYLTLALHSAFVAMGFTNDQNSMDPEELAQFRSAPAVVSVLFTFLVPFLLLHCLEWGRGANKAGGETG
jgi:hypothetical protein